MQTGFFDLDIRYAGLDKLKSTTGGAPLAWLNAAIDWKMFRARLEKVDAKERKRSWAQKHRPSAHVQNAHLAAAVRAVR